MAGRFYRALMDADEDHGCATCRRSPAGRVPGNAAFLAALGLPGALVGRPLPEVSAAG